jgi:toxin ParE1/3/4
MAVELTKAADADLTEIYVYSYREFGEARAEAYFLSLGRCFEQLARFPGMGRSIDYIRRDISGFPTPAILSIL